MTEQVELAIVGAGPAGLHAAIAAGQAGVSVVVVDGYPRPGGQYFSQLPSAFLTDDRSSHQASARSLFGQLEASSVRVLSNTLVWGAFATSDGAGWELTLHGPGAPSSLTAQALILAPGAYDRPIPFPGWTLPGVLTAGAAQTLVKRQRVLPGCRVLLSGTGPLQLAVAASLVRAGADVVGVLDGASLVARRRCARLPPCGGSGRVSGKAGTPGARCAPHMCPTASAGRWCKRGGIAR